MAEKEMVCGILAWGDFYIYMDSVSWWWEFVEAILEGWLFEADV